jgi:hypothetical protein
MMRILLLLLVAFPLFAQEREIQRELIQRQQQSDTFLLQLRQSQDLLRVAPARRPAVEARQLSERQALENVSEQQLREVKAETPFQPQERQRADDERRPFLSPVIEVPAPAIPPPPPLKPRLEGNVDVIGGAAPVRRLVPADGIEPPTNGLQNRCSTN